MTYLYFFLAKLKPTFNFEKGTTYWSQMLKTGVKYTTEIMLNDHLFELITKLVAWQ